jgi:hypothetical protein
VTSYDEIEWRLIALYDGRLTASFAMGHLITHMRYLDVAVEDYDNASRDLVDAMESCGRVVDRFEDLGEAVEQGERERAVLAVAGLRFHYRLDCAYAAARRVLDRLVVVLHELLPRTKTDLGNSHAKLDSLLAKRCAELGVPVPNDLVVRIDDLNDRIKSVRDQIEHPQSPMWMRGIRGNDELVAETWKVVREGGDPMRMQFEPPGAFRDAIHAYIKAMLDLLERVHRESTRKPG